MEREGGWEDEKQGKTGCEKQGARSCGAKVNNEEDVEVSRLAGGK